MATEPVVSDDAIHKGAKPQNHPSDDAAVMQVRVYSPFKVYYEDVAKSVSAESATGPFDILPKHHNFITLLVPCTITIRSDTGDTALKISGGLMHVKADNVIVFLDI